MINIHRRSSFKDQVTDHQWFKDWIKRLEVVNQKQYVDINVTTALGNTRVWLLNTPNKGLENLVIFPGARTTSLIWDLDNGLSSLSHSLNIYLVETNGLPNLSDSASPDIHSTGYGEWAAALFGELGITDAYVAGASFGAQIALKLCMVNSRMVKSVFLLNPGCLQPFSLAFKNLYYNLLPIIKPTEANVVKFLDNAIFCKPAHYLSANAQKLLVDYECFALTRFRDKTQKPYAMDKELLEIETPVYLLLGEKDILFPYHKSAANAKRRFKNLKAVKTYPGVGHGIETYQQAHSYLGEIIGAYKK